jgi:hypothetical protein
MLFVVFCVAPRRNPRKWVFKVTEAAEIRWLLVSSFRATEVKPDAGDDLAKHNSDGRWWWSK